MGDDYPDVRDQLSFIEKVVRTEEERFHETLEEGEQLLLSRVNAAKAGGTRVLAGQDAFQLYDTFGFPIDLTEEICREHGFKVDRDGFTAALNAQRDRARSARQVAEGMNTDRTALENYTEESRFVGYEYVGHRSRSHSDCHQWQPGGRRPARRRGGRIAGRDPVLRGERWSSR